MTGTEMDAPERIAIIGMAGRFPKSRDLDEFWVNLRDGVECISFADGYEEPAAYEVVGDGTFVPAGGALDDIDLFDAPFFGISARDAETMDKYVGGGGGDLLVSCARSQERRVEQVDVVERAAGRDERSVADHLVRRGLLVPVRERDALDAVAEVDPELVEVARLREPPWPCR